MNGQRDHLGESQLKILRRALASPAGQVIVSPQDNAQWCAAKRLVSRGLLERHVFGGLGLGKLTVHQITEAGRERMSRC